MGRYDKYDPKAGGFRAPLDADFPAADVRTVIGVGLSATGRVVRGAGNTGIVGVLVLTQPKSAGEVVDVMTDGEVTDFGGAAGTTYFANPTAGSGAIGTDPDAGGAAGAGAGHRVGFTVEADRLVVRVADTA